MPRTWIIQLVHYNDVIKLDDVSDHQSHDCFLNRLFRRRPEKTSKFRITGLRVGNSPVTGEFPHKRPVTRKMFPFDDVIMTFRAICARSVRCCVLLWFGTGQLCLSGLLHSHWGNHTRVYSAIEETLGDMGNYVIAGLPFVADKEEFHQRNGNNLKMWEWLNDEKQFFLSKFSTISINICTRERILIT